MTYLKAVLFGLKKKKSPIRSFLTATPSSLSSPTLTLRDIHSSSLPGLSMYYETIDRIYPVSLFFFFIFIEFIGVTLVCKTVEVSREQLIKTSPAYYVTCPSPEVKSLYIPIPLTLPTSTYHHPFPLSLHCCL